MISVRTQVAYFLIMEDKNEEQKEYYQTNLKKQQNYI